MGSRIVVVVSVLASLAVSLASLTACERERVEVADSDGGDIAPEEPNPPSFGGPDSGADVLVPTCGPTPPIGRCSFCATGYVTLADGGGTCDCCP